MNYKIIGSITEIETIAAGNSIREIKRLRRIYGTGRWRKLKGIATIQFFSGEKFKAEVHWYQEHGIGKKEFKIKYLLE